MNSRRIKVSSVIFVVRKLPRLPATRRRRRSEGWLRPTAGAPRGSGSGPAPHAAPAGACGRGRCGPAASWLPLSVIRARPDVDPPHPKLPQDAAPVFGAVRAGPTQEPEHHVEARRGRSAGVAAAVAFLGGGHHATPPRSLKFGYRSVFISSVFCRFERPPSRGVQKIPARPAGAVGLMGPVLGIHGR